jgi:hypothetical protein
VVALYIPQGLQYLPTLEPVRDAVQTLVLAQLGAFQAAVEAEMEAHGQPAETLTVPAAAAISQETNADLSVVSLWPSLVILTSASRSISAVEKLDDPRATEWQGELQLLHYEQNADPAALKRTLDRQIAAYWNLLVGNDPLLGMYFLQGETVEIAFSSPNAGAAQRGVGLSVLYRW